MHYDATPNNNMLTKITIKKAGKNPSKYKIMYYNKRMVDQRGEKK